MGYVQPVDTSVRLVRDVQVNLARHVDLEQEFVPLDPVIPQGDNYMQALGVERFPQLIFVESVCVLIFDGPVVDLK